MRDDHKTHRVDIEVTPVRLPDSTHGGFLIHFHEAAGRAEPAASAVESPATPADDTEVEQLREELVAARSHLQSIIEQESAANEELKSANEEILSANEELQSTNEELQTAKEEAQSVNEELRTVNEELQSRNAEIARTNDDLSNLLSSVNTPIVMLGTDLCVRHFTSAASRVLNLTPADVGRSLDRLALPLNVPDLNGLLAEVIATAVPKERDVRDEQGHAYMLRIHPYRTLDNRIDGVTLVLFDIDSIRKAQQAVQASRDYAMAIVQTVQNPLLILDQDLRVRTASREYCETFRVTSQEVEGQLFYEMSGGQWDDVRLRSVLSSVLPSGVSVEEFEIERDFPRIGRRTLVISARRLLSEEGQTPLILLMLKDITDRKQLEARLQERMGEVIEANAAKDQFLAALSHELRTPLTPVLLTATSLEKRRDLPADVRDQLAALRRNIGLETRLIDDLLDLTRIARGKLKLDLRPCDACEFLKQTLQMYEGDIKAKQLHITLDLKAEHCSIMADGPRFQQVFWNLLNNAVKFTPPSGHIAIRAFNTERGRLVVEVADTGIGIGPDVLPRLFHAFEQGRSKVTRRYGGLGLGLAIAKAITELHHGSLRAESLGANRGATFTIELPVSIEAEKRLTKACEPASVAPASSVSVPPLSILLVEDHHDTRDLMETILSGLGHEVKTAGSVAAGKELAAEYSFDLVISDLGLPDGSGLDLMQHLRREHGLKGIALTGYGMEEDLARTREAGFAKHLVKPIDFEQLETAISRVASAT